MTDDERWRHLAAIATALCKSKGHSDDTIRKDIRYLKNAFVETESLWHGNRRRVKQPHVVMLSEAPLFGGAKSYFYNPDTPLTAFFRLSDAGAILGEPSQSKLQDLQEDHQKRALIKQLDDVGFIVLDVFPFAFNETDTELTYKTLKAAEYRKLFEDTAPYHFDHLVKPIVKYNPRFVFRYKRLATRLEKLVIERLRNFGLANHQRIPSIGGRNMPIDKSKLKRVWNARLKRKSSTQ